MITCRIEQTDIIIITRVDVRDSCRSCKTSCGCIVFDGRCHLHVSDTHM